MICYPEILKTEIDKLKKILARNGYPLEFINRFIKSHDDNRRKPRLFGPEKFPAVTDYTGFYSTVKVPLL